MKNLFNLIRNNGIFTDKIIIGNLEFRPEYDNCLLLYGIKKDFYFTYEEDNDEKIKISINNYR